LSFLLAGRSSDENIKQVEIAEHKHVNIHDRGGLWKVKHEVTCIFSVAESFFKASVRHHGSKIDSKAIVTELMKDSWVLVNFSLMRKSSSHEIKKEVALNLLYDLLTLYIRVRAFSYAKDQQQLHKIQKSKTKASSLRTSIKKKTSSLDQGH